MSTEKTYVVMTERIDPREYSISELVWLWRTGQLPSNAEYRDADGHWQPLRELVEPMIADEQRAATVKTSASNQPANWRWLRPLFALLAFTLLIGGIIVGPRMRTEYLARKALEEEALRYEQEERLADLVGSKVVVPGMTADQVRKSRGTPRIVIASGSQEEWSYGRETVIFENGLVIQIQTSRR